MSTSFSPYLKVNWRGTFIHELFHAFGIAHTHRRQDRDKYIKVLWSINIGYKIYLKMYFLLEECGGDRNG